MSLEPSLIVRRSETRLAHDRRQERDDYTHEGESRHVSAVKRRTGKFSRLVWLTLDRLSESHVVSEDASLAGRPSLVEEAHPVPLILAQKSIERLRYSRSGWVVGERKTADCELLGRVWAELDRPMFRGVGCTGRRRRLLRPRGQGRNGAGRRMRTGGRLRALAMAVDRSWMGRL